MFFLINKYNFCFYFDFFQTKQYFMLIFLKELFRSEQFYFSEDDFVDLFVPPDNTYVQFHSLLSYLGSS
jgi:hypothetical protein